MRTLQTVAVALLGAALWAFTLAPLRAAEAPAYRIIVHPSNSTTSVSRKFAADAFLKRITRWPEGEAIRPVDLPPDNPARRRFSEEVLERSVSAVRSYWQQIVFAGRGVPPPELESEAAVVRFVLKNPGAVGYVSGTADLGGTKTLTIR